ncbi:MAG: hypothetical protein GDA46_05065, partial [Bdellovibrionales bacterium]|nr:hypothetical protein [Bdellovibrionales bacterium]
MSKGFSLVEVLIASVVMLCRNTLLQGKRALHQGNELVFKEIKDKSNQTKINLDASASSNDLDSYKKLYGIEGYVEFKLKCSDSSKNCNCSSKTDCSKRWSLYLVYQTQVMGTFVLNQKPIQSINVTYTGLRDEDFTCEDEIKSQQFCQQGQSVIGFDKDGSMICGSAVESKTCQAGYVVTGIDSRGNVNCGKDLDTRVNSRTCSTGYVVSGIDSRGNVICRKDLDTRVN